MSGHGDGAPGPRRRGVARAVLPWLVAVGCLAYAFHVVPVAECLAALRQARLAVFLPLAGGAVLLWFGLESAAYAHLFSRFGPPLTGRDARSLRALSYLLTLVHWHLAKAAVVLRLNATHGVPLISGASTLLLYQMIGVLVLALFAGAGALLSPGAGVATGSAAPVARPLAAHVATGSLLLAAGVALALVALRSDRPRLRALDAIRSLALFRSHRLVRLADVAYVGGVKAAYQMVFVLVYYFGLRAFGVAPDFTHVLVATAILQAVGGLPIAPAGLGTQQAAMLLLFSDPAAGGRDGPAILAFGFSLPITTMLVRGLLAALYLGDLSRPGPASAPGGPSASARRSATTRV